MQLQGSAKGSLRPVRHDGDTVDAVLKRMGFETSAAHRARVRYLVNRGELEEFAEVE